MKVRVRYFASIREALGAGEIVDAADGSSVGALRDALIARGGAHAAALARSRALGSALDQVGWDEAAPRAEGAQLAFFPPVTGG